MSQRRDQPQLLLDPIRLRGVDGPVEQNAEVDITLAVLGTVKMLDFGTETAGPD